MLRSRIFLKLYFGLIALVLMTTGITGVLVTNRIEQDEMRKAISRLQADVELLADVVANSNPARLPSRVHILSDTLKVRFTVFDNQNIAIADSATDNLADLNDPVHVAARTEIALAAKDNIGTSSRYSSLLGEHTIYVALRVQTKDDAVYYTRAAIPLAEVQASASYARRSVLLGASIGVIVSLLVGFYFTQWIIRPLRKMTILADSIARGGYSVRVPVRSNDEFGRLGTTLNTMAARIEADIHARETTEQLLRESQNELEQRVLARTAELTKQINERQRTEIILQASEERYRDLVENANDIIYTLDLNYRFTSLNKVGEQVSGYTAQELAGFDICELVAPEYQASVAQFIRQPLAKNTKDNAQAAIYELEIVTRDGRRVMLEVNSRLIRNGDSVIGVQGIARDVSERKAAQAQLMHNALHDALTDLPNRLLFTEYLQTALARAKRDPEQSFAVLFLDIDRFKLVNDSLGHLAGDKLLVQIAERLKEVLRPGDTVARLGGDEFTILLPDLSDTSDAVHVAERIQSGMLAPFKLDEHEVFTTASIGIALNDKSLNLVYEKAQDLLRDADMAMYQAKRAGKARHQVFDPQMHVHAVTQLQMENDLRRAIERCEFRLYYQPIVELATNRIVEFEALVRWQHPTRGLVVPNEFIALAEETDLIVPMGQWVLAEACRQLSVWRKPLADSEPLTVSVNLSVNQFRQEDFVAQIKQLLQDNNLSARYLNLEITESAIMENGVVAAELLADLRALGVGLTTDDFGTGYSSLSYLHRFPIDRLKIDRSFIQAISEKDGDAAIVRTILTLASTLKMDVVAEGIETEVQLAQLCKLGCAYGQGYLFSKPLTAAAASKLLLPHAVIEAATTTTTTERGVNDAGLRLQSL